MSKQAKILLIVILIWLVCTVFVFRTTKILLIGIALLLIARNLNQLSGQLKEAHKIERMGDYFTAYKFAQKFGEYEATVIDWCVQNSYKIIPQFKNPFPLPKKP